MARGRRARRRLVDRARPPGPRGILGFRRSGHPRHRARHRRHGGCLKRLLKLAKATKDKAARARYRAAAEATITALVTHYLTPTSPADKRAPGILTESCFNKRPDARPHDAANRCEFIFADYYLLECRQFPTPARFVPFPWPRYDAPCVGCYRLAMPQVG